MSQKTFLQLCQDVARESGTITGVLPLTVTGQTGRLKKVVECTAGAWRALQNLHPSWFFMRKEFSKTLTIDVGRYAASALGLTDLARWGAEGCTYSFYDPAIGVADERTIERAISWQEWRVAYGRGTQVSGPPGAFTVSPTNEICLGPLPDKAYTFNGEYFRTQQNLTADADVPILPADLHDIIVWRGLLLLAEGDEAVTQIQTATVEYARLLSSLEALQLPVVEVAANPLA